MFEKTYHEPMKLKLDFFIHPIPLAAVTMMALNDHWLKYEYPSWWTGKLSDFAGVFYLPIFLLALRVFIRQLLGKEDPVGKSLTKLNFWAAVLFTDLLLILVKLSAPFARFVETAFAESLFRIQIIQDPSDLIALSMNVLTYWYMKNRLTNSKAPIQR